ncbi:MAG: hypothetical protein KDD47_04055, partial [Acidobacteria bacterium]|nr:hypothetical protein [Acidobacteriota bacterium]
GWLRSDLAVYRLADLEVRRLRNALEEMRDEASALRTVLVAGAPDFVRTDGLQPVAKVFQYGLHEAAAPPFAADGLFVYPLPPDAPAELMPALSRVAGGPVLRWNRERQRLEPWPAVGLEEEAPGRIALLGGVSGTPSEKLSFRCREGARVRLFLLTPGPPYRSGFETVSGGRGEIELPRSFLSGMAGLYRGRALGWLEDRDSRGRLVAASEIFSLSLESFEDR